MKTVSSYADCAATSLQRSEWPYSSVEVDREWRAHGGTWLASVAKHMAKVSGQQTRDSIDFLFTKLFTLLSGSFVFKIQGCI